MTQFFKGIALLVIVTCAVWVGVLWHWESTSRNMTTTDIVVYLGLLPIFVCAVLLGLRWAWRGAGPRREAALAAAAAAKPPAQANAADASAARDEAARHGTSLLLSAHVACAAGVSADELLNAAGDNKPRPEFDDALHDSEGSAVMCARMADAKPEELADVLEPVLDALRANRPEWQALDMSMHALRALAALAEPLASALQDLRPWAVRLGAPDPQGPHNGGALPRGEAQPAAMVRVLLGLPAAWSEFEREAATEWVRQQVPEQTDVPLARFAINTYSVSGEELWLKADQLLQTLAREQRNDLMLVAACHSDLSEAAVAELEQQGRLFSAQRQPKGAMPGEGAAALLLAGDQWPLNADAYLPPMHLHRPAVLRRDKSVDAAGRVSSQCLQDSTTHALAAAHVPAEALTALVCDGDQHTPRGTELFGTTLAMLPQLDPGEDMRLIGTVTGHTGAVNALLVIAAAAQRARSDDKPCLALCVGDPFMRLAVVVRPAQAAAPQA